jgi:hypothetical protein
MDRYYVEDEPSQGSYAIWDSQEDDWKVIEVFTWLPDARHVALRICEMLNHKNT